MFELIRELNRERYRPFLMNSCGSDMSQLAEESGVKPTCMEFPQLKPGNIFKIFWFLFNLTGFVVRNKISIIHANTSRAMFYGGVIAKLLRRPIIWHVRITDRDPWLDRILYYFSDVVICNSKATASRFKGYKNQEKIKIVYNGLNPSRYGKANKRSVFKDIPQDHKIVLNVGRIEPWKRQDLFIEMARIIKGQRQKVKFVIVGEDKSPGKEYFNKLKEMTKNFDLNDTIVFMGEQNNIPAILGEGDILVLTSKIESFGRVLLEAGASQMPVLAFKVGGIAEIVDNGNTGFLEENGNIDSMVEKILLLFSDEKLSLKMGAMGRKKVREEFTSTLHAKKMEEIYEGLNRWGKPQKKIYVKGFFL